MEMEWMSEYLTARCLDNTLDNVPCVYIFKHKNKPEVWDACIVFMSYPKMERYDLGGMLGELMTGVPNNCLSSFQASKQEWHCFLMRHEAAHIRMGHVHNYNDNRHRPLICETEADFFALNDSLFITDNHPLKVAVHAIRAMATLFCHRDENVASASVNNHATNIFLDPMGRLERDPEKEAPDFFEVHLKINRKAHILLSETDSNSTKGKNARLMQGKNISLNNLPMFYTAIKILAEQGQFPAGSPEAVMCAEFLEACKNHIAPEYLNTPETRCFYDECMASADVLKKAP